MSDLKELKALLAKIDTVLESYNPGEMKPDGILSELIAESAKQSPILENVIRLSTKGLEKFPYNPELLWRRAIAGCQIATPAGEYPHLELAEQDLRTILALDPNNLSATFALLSTMFKFSGLADKEVAEIAGEFAAKCERLLLQSLALQIKALGYAGEYGKAEEIHDRWIRLFPESELLKEAKEDADSMDSRE